MTLPAAPEIGEVNSRSKERVSALERIEPISQSAPRPSALERIEVENNLSAERVSALERIERIEPLPVEPPRTTGLSTSLLARL
ncbi:unnamed protein product [Brassica oleracea]